jgi:hypothetical protein
MGRWVTTGYRLAGAALAVTGLAYAFVAGGADPVNFVSYFTVLSNIIGAAVLAVTAVRCLRGAPPTRGAELWRGAAVLYMATTGIVYAVLLSGVDTATPTVANWILHRIMPVVLVLDWLAAPPGTPLRYRQVTAWLAFPLAYLAYTLVRGPLVDWYPYPFLDPRRPGGYGRVAGMSVAVAVLVVLLGLLIAWLGNRLARRRADAARPSPRTLRA